MILFDTNVLLYSRDKKDPRYKTCRSWIKRVEDHQIEGVTTVQNIVEFISVSIQLARISHRSDDANILRYSQVYQEDIFRIIYPIANTMIILHKLLQTHHTAARKVFDVFLIATMLSNGLKEILTYNIDDFKSFPQIKVIHPENI